MEENKENEYKKYVDLMEARVKGNKTTGKSVKYLEKLCAEMKNLNRMIGQCYIKNEDQQYPMIGQKQMEAMKKSYDACIRYASLARNKDSRTDILNSVYKVLLADRCQIKELKETDVFAENFRKEILHFKDLNIKTVGGALSERIPICYRDDEGTMHQGFFTKESIYERKDFQKERNRLGVETDTKAGYGPVIQRLTKSKSFLQFMKSKGEEELMSWFVNEKAQLITKYDDPQINVDTELWKEILNNNGQSTEGIVAKQDKGDGTAEIIAFFAMYFSAEAKANFEKQENMKRGLYETDAGIRNGDNLTDRNCAMSQIARLLGREELLANSVPMQIRVGKDKVQGVFMEKAKGINISTWEEQGRHKKLYPMTATALKDIADIQIIDYICGNVDRHMGNMIYQFDENGNLNHIVGIDHDLSMGEKSNIGGILRLPKLKNMPVVSESMADRVQNMKPEELQLMLGGLDLSEKQKAAAWKRVVEVQGRIKNAKKMKESDYSRKLVGENCYIVPDSEWGKLNVENLISETITPEKIIEVEKLGEKEKKVAENKIEDQTSYNLFSGFYYSQMQKEAAYKNRRGKNSDDKNQEEEEEEWTFLEGIYTSPTFSEYGIEKNKEEIDRIAEQMQHMFGKEGLKNRGEEFRNMYQNVQMLQSWFEAHKNFEDISMEDKRALRNAYEQTKESCQTYIRKHNPWTKIGKDRQNAATELMEFIGTQGIAIDEYFALQEKTGEIISKNEGRIKELSQLSNALKKGLETTSAKEKKACQEAVDAQKNLYIMSTKKELSPENQKDAMKWIKELVTYDQVKGYMDENWKELLKNKNRTPKDLRQFLETEAKLREQACKEKQAEKQEEKVVEKGKNM